MSLDIHLKYKKYDVSTIMFMALVNKLNLSNTILTQDEIEYATELLDTYDLVTIAYDDFSEINHRKYKIKIVPRNVKIKDR